MALTSYTLDGSVAVITLDDGRANAMSPDMLAAIGRQLDRAQAEAKAVVLVGRPGVFSGGFDLSVLKRGGPRGLRMLRGGFQLATRLLAFPWPVVVASTGHAVALGLFLVLTADQRLGAAGAFHYQANEVAIDLTVPRTAVALCTARLSPHHLTRVTALSEAMTPTDALAAGALDRVVDADSLLPSALQCARELSTTLDPRAFAETKRRLYASTLRAMRTSLPIDTRDWAMLGLQKAFKARVQPSTNGAR